MDFALNNAAIDLGLGVVYHKSKWTGTSYGIFQSHQIVIAGYILGKQILKLNKLLYYSVTCLEQHM